MFVMCHYIFMFQDIGAKAAEFSQLSGLYTVHLIIGDAILSNSFTWHVADVQLKLALEPSQAPQPTSAYKPKPEIKVILSPLFSYFTTFNTLFIFLARAF